MNDSLLTGAQTVGDNAAVINEAELKNQKFDPSKFISEDFLQILNEHRKNCEREGKLEQATLARKRLKELRIFEEQKRKEAEISARQKTQLSQSVSRNQSRKGGSFQTTFKSSSMTTSLVATINSKDNPYQYQDQSTSDLKMLQKHTPATSIITQHQKRNTLSNPKFSLA